VERTDAQPLVSPVSAVARQAEGCKRGLAIDLATVYCEYYRCVFMWCLRIVRNEEDAEDLTQDAFVHVMRKIDTFRGEATFSTWLYRVVMNTVFMQLRRKRLLQTSLDEVLACGEPASWSCHALCTVDKSLGETNARIDLDRAIDQLPVGFKMVLLLHDVEHYTHDEIAAIRGWSSAGTSKSQLHKARRRLRDLLKCE
jgi:RNA polymerase sigma-70 factor (ECF subfamily)